MPDESITVTAARPRYGVLTLGGYGIRVAVDRGHLIVADGRGRDRRQGRFPRTTRELKRLVIIGHTGSVTLDALRWLHDRGCAFVQIDSNGQLIAVSGPQGLDDARLRRAQALAAGNETGFTIARDLLTRKLDGQAAVLDGFNGGDGAVRDVRRFRDELAHATTAEQLRILEAQAASIYWRSWADVRVRFARKAVARFPDHWQTFGSRTSPLTNSPRLAVNPINALLGYLYAILEAESRVALVAVGLDPGLGVLHADLKARDSMALDVMEAVRPDIDTYVLTLLQSRPFGCDDFFERRDGCCRLLPPVTRMLAETAPRWAAAVGPIVEAIAQTLMNDDAQPRSSTSPQRLPTPLTQANRRAGRAKVRRRARQTVSPPPAKVPAACLDCGTILDDARRRYCDACGPAVQKEQVDAFAATGRASIARRRAAGDDPAHGGDAGKARGHRNAIHHHAIAEWKRDTPEVQDSTHFSRNILPKLQGVSLRAMADATGLTPGYCSFVRRGLKVPHRRHWAVLTRLGGDLGDGADDTESAD